MDILGIKESLIPRILSFDPGAPVLSTKHVKK